MPTTINHPQSRMPSRRPRKPPNSAGHLAREDLLRELGFGVVRLVWSDLADPTRVHAKMLAEITILRQRRLW